LPNLSTAASRGSLDPRWPADDNPEAMVLLEGVEAVPGLLSRTWFRMTNRRPPAHLRNIALFSECSDRDLRDIARIGYEKSFSQGACLTREGDPGESLFVILEGSLGIQREGESVAMRGPSEFIGEIALLSHSSRTATVTALVPTKAFVIPGRAFRALLGRRPELQRKAIEALALRVPEN
jgi:CRP-like cAMP-binding protein